MKYAITDKIIWNSGFNHADFILFRDKNSQNYAKNAQVFCQNFRNFKKKLFLHDDIELALRLEVDGIHFSSKHLASIKNAPKELIKIASTHCESELRQACENGANFVTFSPVFSSPNKGEPKGLAALNYAVQIAQNYKVGVIALGGVLDAEQIKAVLKAGACGFASIRYFQTKA